MNTRGTLQSATILTCAFMLSLAASSVHAQEDPGVSVTAASTTAVNLAEPLPVRPTIAPEPHSSEEQQSYRERLAARGIVFGLKYQGEVFGNLLRGSSAKRGVALLGSGQSSLELELSKMGIGRGQIVLGAQTLHGKGINDSRLGAVQLPSNLDAERYTRLIDAWYGDSWFGDRLRFKLGRQYADAEFGVIENGGDFLNASYGVVPTSPMPTYPLPAFGVTAWVSPVQWLSVGAGAFRGDNLNPVGEEGDSVRKGAFVLTEAKIEPHSKTSSSYGVYRFGVWQQARGAWSADATDSADPVRNYGVYAVADYWFRRKSDEDRGPGVFVRWGWAPSARNEVSGYWGGGVNCPGLNPLRPQDTVGLGVTRVALAAAGRETAYEVFYKLQVSTKITLQPDLQWVHRPSGEGPNGIVAGLRLGLGF